MTTLVTIVALIFCGVALAARAGKRSDNGETDEPAPCSHADPRCIATIRRLEDARAAMIARGTPTLLGGRPPWTRVTGGQVVPIRRA